MANIQPSTVDWGGKPRTLARGQIATSLHELGKRGQCDVKTVSRHLCYLVRRGTISMDRSYTGTVITILNYEEYQGQDAEGSTPPPHDRDDLSHTIGRTPGIHNEEVKNKRIKEYSELDPIFEQLMKKYRDLFPGTTTGSGARTRFDAQFKNVDATGDLDTSLTHYRQLLDFHTWRQAKTTFANYLGTKRSGFPWLEYVPAPNLIETAGSAPADNWEQKATRVMAALDEVSPGSSGAHEHFTRVLGPDLLAIVHKVHGGMAALRTLPRNGFLHRTVAGMLKDASAQMELGGG